MCGNCACFGHTENNCWFEAFCPVCVSGGHSYKECRKANIELKLRLEKEKGKLELLANEKDLESLARESILATYFDKVAHIKRECRYTHAQKTSHTVR